MKSVDYKEGERITLICLFGNLVLSILKGLAGFFGGSKAMIADSFHSASDVIATVVVYVSIKIAKKPVDHNHPYGHGKIEPLSAAFVGLTLIYAGFVIIKGIIESIATHSFQTPSFIALLAALISIIVKEIMFKYTYATGKKINSEAIMANAWDHRSDAYSSIGTFLGILGSMAGKYFNIHMLEYLDPIAGALVACLIFKVAIEIIINAIKGLMDSSPEPEKIHEIKSIARNVDGVHSISWIKARYIGQHFLVDMAIDIDGDKSVEEGHNIAVLVKSKVLKHIQEAGDVLIHIHPYKPKLME